MKSEYVSIETLRIMQDLEKENKELHNENKRLNNIINEALGIAAERFNYYHHINNKEALEDWAEIFDILAKRDNQELKGSDEE